MENLRHLFATLELARHGTFVNAASQVGLSQSALSQAVQKLERRAGTTLFVRTQAGAQPTPEGARLLIRLERAFDFLAEGEKALSRDGKKRTAPLHRSATTAHWSALIAIVDTGGFSNAARRLGLSQPSLYRAARDLERLSGTQLFNATTQGVAPTQNARRLARAARLAFSEIERGLDEIREMRGIVDGRLSVGCLPFARTHWAPAAILSLLERHANAQVRILDGPYHELLQELRDGRIDLILGALRPQTTEKDIVQQSLFETPLAIVVRSGHPILAKKRPSIRELAALDWIAPNSGTPARQQFEAFFSGQKCEPPQRIIECSSLVATRALLVGSDRAALLSAGQARFEEEAGILTGLPHALPGTERQFGITTRANWRPTTLQSTFLTLVEREASAMAKTMAERLLPG